MIIWWLFDGNYSWLFDDYSISEQAASWLVCFISKSLRMEQWHILVMAAFPLGISQQNLRFIIHNNLPSDSGFDPPSTLPRSASSIFLREVVNPAITQNLTVSCTQITNLFCNGVAFIRPFALRNAIIDSYLK